jgi:hypothetical protein
MAIADLVLDFRPWPMTIGDIAVEVPAFRARVGGGELGDDGSWDPETVASALGGCTAAYVAHVLQAIAEPWLVASRDRMAQDMADSIASQVAKAYGDAFATFRAERDQAVADAVMDHVRAHGAQLVVKRIERDGKGQVSAIVEERPPIVIAPSETVTS